MVINGAGLALAAFLVVVHSARSNRCRLWSHRTWPKQTAADGSYPRPESMPPRKLLRPELMHVCFCPSLLMPSQLSNQEAKTSRNVLGPEEIDRPKGVTNGHRGVATDERRMHRLRTFSWLGSKATGTPSEAEEIQLVDCTQEQHLSIHLWPTHLLSRCVSDHRQAATCR